MTPFNSVRRSKMALIALAVLVGIQVVAILVSVYAISYPNIAKRIREIGSHILPEGAQDVTIRSRGGQDLRSWYFPNEECSDTILICHGRSSSKVHQSPYIAALVKQYSVLAVDFRGHGQNAYGRTSIGFRESQDVLGALDWLSQNGVTNVAIFGHSMGAAAAIKAVGEHHSGRPAVRALALEGVFDSLDIVLAHQARKWCQPLTTTWPAVKITEALCGYKIADNVPSELVKNVHCPILVMNASDDKPLPPGCGADVYKNAVGEKEFLVFDGRHDVYCDEVLRRILLFLSKHMPGKARRVSAADREGLEIKECS